MKITTLIPEECELKFYILNSNLQPPYECFKIESIFVFQTSYPVDFTLSTAQFYFLLTYHFIIPKKCTHFIEAQSSYIKNQLQLSTRRSRIN